MQPVPPVDAPQPEDLDRARQMVQRLVDAGYNPEKIARALGGRVSARTVYRWAKGEHVPQRRSDVVALEELVKSIP